MTMRRWTLSALVFPALLWMSGCAEQQQEMRTLQQQNAALEHDQVRLQRELQEARRELDRTRTELAEAREETSKAKSLLKATEESAARDRSVGRNRAEQDQAMQNLQTQISARLMETERKLAEKVAQNATAREQLQVLQEKLEALSTELEKARAELRSSRRGATTAPRRVE